MQVGTFRQELLLLMGWVVALRIGRNVCSCCNTSDIGQATFKFLVSWILEESSLSVAESTSLCYSLQLFG